VNKVVARYQDGRVLKGTTSDFFAGKDLFHLMLSVGGTPITVSTAELKALFFVKDHNGNPEHNESNEFDSSRPPTARPIKVVFKDGEILVGTTTGYRPGRPGFFLEPADPESNIERCYIVVAATGDISFI
jgi:hypothetical protein